MKNLHNIAGGGGGKRGKEEEVGNVRTCKLEKVRRGREEQEVKEGEREDESGAGMEKENGS